MNPSYIKRVQEIYANQNFKEFYSRLFSGKISPFIAAACCGTSITPNHLTAMMVPVGILGGFLLSHGTSTGYIAGGLLFILLNIIDAADGELARYTGQTSDFGDYLDRIAHYMTNTALIIGMGLGLYAETGRDYIVPLMLLANSAIIGDDAMRDLLVTCGLEKSDGGSVERKIIKVKSKISLSGLGNVIGPITSNIAIFHIVPILALIEYIFNFSLLMEAYFILAAGATILKFIVRSVKIRTFYA